jgi:hypothetical protein
MRVPVFSTVLCLFLFSGCAKQQTKELLPPWTEGAFETREYRNIFTEIGYTEAEVEERLEQIFYNLFEGNNRIYFEVGDSLAYISDVKNNDVRSEGMSYGMMIAVQLIKKRFSTASGSGPSTTCSTKTAPCKDISGGAVKRMARQTLKGLLPMVSCII